MKTSHRYILLALALVLGSCKAYQNVIAPQTPPESFRNAVVTTDTTSIADMPLKNFFADATLQRLIDTAISYNSDMQLAIKNIDEAQLLVKQVRWNYIPTADLQVTTSSSRPSDNSLNGLSLGQYLGSHHIEDYSAGVNLAWEADVWGKIRNQNKAALANYLQTQEARRAIQTNLVNNVAQGYYNLLMLDEQLAIAHKNVALNDSTLRIIKLQYNAGQVTTLAIQQAQAQQLAAAKLVPQFEQNIAVQENALQILTGRFPGNVNVTAKLDDFRVPENLSTGIPGKLLSRRPDVRSHEFQLQAANAQVGITKADMYPALRITASGGVNSFRTSNWFNIPASLFGIVSGSVLQPVLQHKQLSTQYNIARIDRDKAVIEFRQSVLVAVGEVSDALVKVEKLKSQQAIASTRVETLKHATTNANLLFKNGLANYLEVITAQSNVLQSELELASIKTSELNAVAELYRALGGGWN
jgi:multidrug efflux system outer membrane protein